jgi:superfamily II DNA or RNA helicase
VCLALPGERFLIVSPGRDDVLGLAKRLSEGMPSKAVGVVGAGRNEPGRRITVATAKSIPKADIESITFVIVDEAHQCGDNLISRYLGHLGECYMFGFTASPGMRSDGADMVMEALFGEVIAKGEYQEAVDNGNVVPLEVRLYPAPGSPCYKKKTVARRRECYWRNQGRNKLIARLAGEFPDDEQVLVMVDTIEHGLFLRKEMPGFTFVYRPPSKEDWEMYRRMGLVGADEEPISRKAQDSAADDFRSGKLTKVISTGVWKQAVDFPDLSVLIRADGGGSGIGSIQIPGRLSRLSDGKDKGILIDFNDDFDAWPQTRSLKRKGFYKKQGWEIKNVK